jgi:hypothetical protein
MLPRGWPFSATSIPFPGRQVNDCVSPFFTSGMSAVNWAIRSCGGLFLPSLRSSSAQPDARGARSMLRRKFMVTRFVWRESITVAASLVRVSR